MADSIRENHPPWGTLSRVADQYRPSMAMNNRKNPSGTTSGSFHTVSMTRLQREWGEVVG